jgi:PAS domain S-box-containing protein
VSAAAALALLAAGAWSAAENLVHVQRELQLRDQTHAAELALTALVSTLKDAETGQRGYLLTGDPSYLAPYTLARAQIGAAFVALNNAPLQGSRRNAELVRLRRLSAGKLDELSRTISLYRAGQQAAAIALVRTNAGQQLMEGIRTEADTMQADIDRRSKEEALRLPASGSWIRVALCIIGAFTLLGWIVLQQVRLTRIFAASTNQLERFTRAFGMGLGMIRSAGGQIIVWSQGSERLYGHTAEEAVGRQSHALLNTRFPAPLAEIEAALQANGYWQGELMHRRRDGSELRVLSHWALHRGKNPAEDLVIEVNSDITSLARTDALLRTIVETAPVLIYAKDLDGRLLLANPPTLELIGRPWEEVEGRTDLEVLANVNEAAVVMDTDRALMQQGEVEFVDELVGQDETGAPRIWSSCKAPMFNGMGAVIGMVGVSLEITAQRRIEVQLRKQAIELEAAYADMADFAHIIAHDLRAPLRAVRSLASWIAEDLTSVANAETLANLTRLDNRVERMSMLLEGLLSFSKAGHAKAPVEPVDVAALVVEISEMLAPPPGMRVRYEGDDLTLRTARPPLMHVLQNLISNAIKHHDRAEGLIVVRAVRTDLGTVFSVTDDGPGIPHSAHKKIFDIFQTVAGAEAGTSGVGLAIVRKTVEARGGKVSVESEPALRGAKFIFTWPEGAFADSDAVKEISL